MFVLAAGQQSPFTRPCFFHIWARLERSTMHTFMCGKDHLPQWNQNFILSSGGSVSTIICSFVICHSWDVTQLILCCVDETLLKILCVLLWSKQGSVTTWKFWMVGKQVLILFLFMSFYIYWIFHKFRKSYIVEKIELSMEGAREEMTVLLVWWLWISKDDLSSLSLGYLPMETPLCRWRQLLALSNVRPI